MHFNVTASPTAARIWRQVVEATALGGQAKFLIHDNPPSNTTARQILAGCS